MINLEQACLNLNFNTAQKLNHPSIRSTDQVEQTPKYHQSKTLINLYILPPSCIIYETIHVINILKFVNFED